MASAALLERPTPTKIPSLESGDRMDRAEFERRYNCRPDIKKAELIDGVVYVSSPVRIIEHADPHGILIALLGAYRLTHTGVLLGDNGTWRCPDGSEVQPDATLRYRRSHGGTSWSDQQHYLDGVPELCAEVAGSSLSYDLHVKKELYRRLGVREYLVWQTEDDRIDWWRLESGEYISIEPGADGFLHSTVFQGLTLKPAEMIALAAESDEEP